LAFFEEASQQRAITWVVADGRSRQWLNPVGTTPHKMQLAIQPHRHHHHQSKPRRSIMSSGNTHVETVQSFFFLLEEGQYEEAADLLADEVYFSSPKFTYKSKAEWLKSFPSFHKKSSKNGPAFGPLITGKNDMECSRHGKAKLMGISITVVERITVDNDGKIVASILKKV
jgi:hypothetical protein